MALDFEVTPAVLVPNPDTEVLVQRAVALARQSAEPMRVADVGTGSGCIAIAVAHYASNAEVWASDISAEALDVATRNVARHELAGRVHLACGDLFDSLPGTFDLLCANLPYVAAGARLPAEVTAQPARALFAGQDGAALVLRAEIDPAIVVAAGEAAGRAFAHYTIHRDLGGHERVIESWS